jgi:YD repeat-containing protein
VSGDYSLAFNDASGDLECDSAPESPLVGDPIDVHSGTFYLEEHDIGVATGCADMSLRFVRTYRHGAPSTGSLGPGWTHNFEMRVITAKNDYVMVQRPRGSLLIFQDVGGDVYASRADSSWSLLKCSEGGWILAHRDRRAEVYDAQGRLTALQDANGNQMWMTYETVTRNGATTTRLARVDAPGGRFLWFGYDYYRPGRIIVVGDNADRRMRFGYDDNKAYDFIDDGVLVSATDATGAVSTYTDATDSWRMLKKTDALGRDVFVNEYDASGRVIRQQLNTGQDLRLSYTVITDTAEIQNRLGAAEAQGLHALLETTVQDQAGSASYTFGSDGLLRLMTDPAGATTRYQQYTAARKPGVIVDALGRTTRMAYNERGQVVRITDALSQTTQIEYDRWGLPTRLTGQGQSYDMQYNGPRLIEVRDQNGQHMSFGYSDQAGWKNVLTSMQHSGSLTTTLTLNTAGDVTELRDALGRSTRLQYDAAGRLTQRTDPRGSVTTLTYDAADRVIQVDQAADGQTRTTRATYNAVGDPLTLTDALGHTARFGPDDAGRVISQTLADGRQLDVRFDPRSNLTGLTPPDRGMHAFRFTPVNLIQQYQPPTLPDGRTPQPNTPTISPSN